MGSKRGSSSGGKEVEGGRCIWEQIMKLKKHVVKFSYEGLVMVRKQNFGRMFGWMKVRILIFMGWWKETQTVSEVRDPRTRSWNITTGNLKNKLKCELKGLLETTKMFCLNDIGDVRVWVLESKRCVQMLVCGSML